MSLTFLVSACLVGFRCRYDGGTQTAPEVLRVLEGHSWIAVCPEQWAGLPTPRPSMMFVNGTGNDVIAGNSKVICVDGSDMTDRLVTASRSLIRAVKRFGIETAILKERSPSCGVKRVYVGETQVSGKGIFTALLEREGIILFSEEDVSSRAGRRGP